MFVDFSHLDQHLTGDPNSIGGFNATSHQSDFPTPPAESELLLLRRRKQAAGKKIAHFIWKRMVSTWERMITSAALVIQRTWRRQQALWEARRARRFTLNGLVPRHVAEKIQAQLLGIRVRKLLRKEEMKRLICAIAELTAVLGDLPSDTPQGSPFVSSIQNQIRHLQESVWRFFFQKAYWNSSAGYWFVGPSNQAVLKSSLQVKNPQISLAHLPIAAKQVVTSPKDMLTSHLNNISNNIPSSSCTNAVIAHKEPSSSAIPRKGPVALATLIPALARPPSPPPTFVPAPRPVLQDERPIIPSKVRGNMSSGSLHHASPSSDTCVAATTGGMNESPSVEKSRYLLRRKGSGSGSKKKNRGEFICDSTRNCPFIELFIKGAHRLMPASKVIPTLTSSDVLPFIIFDRERFRKTRQVPL